MIRTYNEQNFINIKNVFQFLNLFNTLLCNKYQQGEHEGGTSLRWSSLSLPQELSPKIKSQTSANRCISCNVRAILIPKWTNDSPNGIHHLQEDWQYKYMIVQVYIISLCASIKFL